MINTGRDVSVSLTCGNLGEANYNWDGFWSKRNLLGFPSIFAGLHYSKQYHLINLSFSSVYNCQVINGCYNKFSFVSIHFLTLVPTLHRRCHHNTSECSLYIYVVSNKTYFFPQRIFLRIVFIASGLGPGFSSPAKISMCLIIFLFLKLRKNSIGSSTTRRIKIVRYYNKSSLACVQLIFALVSRWD